MGKAEQLIRELTEIIIGKCLHCKQGTPLLNENKLAFYYVHENNVRCELKKNEYDIVKCAEAYLMDG